MLGLGLSIPQVAARGSRSLVAAIRSLFAANEPGVWYDPSDLSTLFQDAAGTTPVTAVEQPVGLMLDKSKGLVLGSELVTNGTFDSNINGWIVSSQYSSSTAVEWSNGALHVYNTQGSYGESRSAAIPLTIGKRYVLEMEILAGTTDRYWIIIGSSASNDNDGRIVVTSESSGTSPSGYKRWRYSFVASYATAYLYFATNDLAGSHLYADNVSVRELPGNHAYQTTATSRPVLSARYNLLTKTEQFDAAVWTKATGTSATSSKISATSNATLLYLQVLQAISKDAASRTYVATIEAKEAELRYLGATLQEPFTGVNGVFVHTDLRDAAQINQGVFGSGFTLNSVQRTLLSDGYCRIVITATTNVGASVSFGVQPSKNSTFSSTAYVAGEGVFVRNADLRVANDGANLLPYQRVNTATDYDAVGFPHYLRFDGVDDWLVTNTITPGTDKVQVFAGVRKLQSVTVEIIAETGNSSASLGAFYLVAESANNRYGYAGRGTRVAILDDHTSLSFFPPPDTAVLTVTQDINGNTPSRMRRNAGAWSYSFSTAFGGGNYLAYPLYIGRRGGTTFPFNGHLYSLIIRFGSNLPTATIEKTEKYINTKTRAY